MQNIYKEKICSKEYGLAQRGLDFILGFWEVISAALRMFHLIGVSLFAPGPRVITIV